jgi:hypothetical protein
MTVTQVAEGAWFVTSYSEVTIVPAYTPVEGQSTGQECEAEADQ